MVVRIKRAYEEPGPTDGERILVDRVWPRGRSRDALAIAAWERELAPTDDLRRWFGHDRGRWDEFRRRYEEELATPERQAAIARIRDTARRGKVTLVYGARDEEHNQAIVLRDVLERGEAR